MREGKEGRGRREGKEEGKGGKGEERREGREGKEEGEERKGGEQGQKVREREEEGLLCSCTHHFSINDLEPAQDPREAVGSCVHCALRVQSLAER